MMKLNILLYTLLFFLTSCSFNKNEPLEFAIKLKNEPTLTIMPGERQNIWIQAIEGPGYKVVSSKDNSVIAEVKIVSEKEAGKVYLNYSTTVNIRIKILGVVKDLEPDQNASILIQNK